MAQFFTDFWKVLRLEGQVFNKIGDDQKGLWISLRLFILVSLLVALGGLVSSLSTGPKGVGTGLDALETRLEQLNQRSLPPSMENAIVMVSEKILAISSALEQYRPPLGREASHILRTIGNWLSAPLTYLGRWMSAALAVFLVARGFKGQGELRNHVSVFLLGFLPQILLVVSSFAFLSSAPGWLGNILAVAAFFWSFMVLIAGLKTVHQFSTARSLAVLVITLLIFLVVLPFVSVILASILAAVIL
jgi:hypothetical protein